VSAQTQKRRRTVVDIVKKKGVEPIVSLTAYDAPTASLLEAHCDFLLVGDSVGMVVHGLPTTVGVTLEMMILHGKAVVRGSKEALVVVDLPFGAYEQSPEQAFEAASRVMIETGCGAVKIESGGYAVPTVKYLVERGIPVMAHVGLRPQSVNVDGGFRAKGRTDLEAERVLAEAKGVDEAGAFAIVVEGVDESLAQEVTQAVSAPTIGIGASAACDGQILVTPDMLGLFDWTPKFVRKFGDMKGLIEEAARRYAEAVQERSFPGDAEVYRVKRSS